MTLGAGSGPGAAGIRGMEGMAAVVTAIAQVAIESWRLERLLPRLCEDDQTRVRAIGDRVSGWLSQAGVVTEDLTGREYTEGMILEIVTTEVHPELPANTIRVVETVKPAVYVAGQLVLRGQVVLGQRSNAADPGGPDGTDDN